MKVKPPPGLGPAGSRLWQDMTASFDLDGHELPLLLEACRATDQLDALAAVVAAEGVVVPTGAGDSKPHPALIEARLARLALARVLAALRIPDEGARPQRRPPRGVHRGGGS